MKTDDSYPLIVHDDEGRLWINDGIGFVRVTKMGDLAYARPFLHRGAAKPVTIDEARAILTARAI